MSQNANLYKAKKEKNDEFYTRLEDIEKELLHYKEYFKGKVVLCNCDDPYESNFFKYFTLKFNEFGLKKLICTCYAESKFKVRLFNPFPDDIDKKPYKIEITKQIKDYNGDGEVDLEDIELYLQDTKNNAIRELKGNGDFRSDECIEFLKEADIVVTNPPFSLFRKFVGVLVLYDVDYIIIGNTNALVYSEIFELFKTDKIRTGYTNFNVGMYFRVPDDYGCTKVIDGERYARVSTSCWYTSLPVKKHQENLILWKKYTPEDYPKYDNYDAINVNNFNDIPCDFDGIMGVPVTFLDKYNPNQFEILGLSSKKHSSNIPRFHDNEYYQGYIRGKVVTPVDSNMPLLSTSDCGGTKCSKSGCPDIYQLYWRIFIRNRNPVLGQ